MEVKIYRKAINGERDSKVFHWVPSTGGDGDGLFDLACDLAEIAMGGIEDIHLKRGQNAWVSLKDATKEASLESGDSFGELWELSIRELLHEALGSNLESVYE